MNSWRGAGAHTQTGAHAALENLQTKYIIRVCKQTHVVELRFMT